MDMLDEGEAQWDALGRMSSIRRSNRFHKQLLLTVNLRRGKEGFGLELEGKAPPTIFDVCKCDLLKMCVCVSVLCVCVSMASVLLCKCLKKERCVCMFVGGGGGGGECGMAGRVIGSTHMTFLLACWEGTFRFVCLCVVWSHRCC